MSPSRSNKMHKEEALVRLKFYGKIYSGRFKTRNVGTSSSCLGSSVFRVFSCFSRCFVFSVLCTLMWWCLIRGLSESGSTAQMFISFSLRIDQLDPGGVLGARRQTWTILIQDLKSHILLRLVKIIRLDGCSWTSTQMDAVRLWRHGSCQTNSLGLTHADLTWDRKSVV